MATLWQRDHSYCVLQLQECARGGNPEEVEPETMIEQRSILETKLHKIIQEAQELQFKLDLMDIADQLEPTGLTEQQEMNIVDAVVEARKINRAN